MADAKYWADKAEQYIRDWRVCACGAEVEGKITMGIYNTECGHAIDCDYYLADSLQKHLSGHKPLAPRRGGMTETRFRIMTDGDVFWVEERKSFCFGLFKMWWNGAVSVKQENIFAATKELERRKKLHEPREVTP